MLRQYALIFLLFLLTFSVLFGCPSRQDDIKSTQDDVQSEQDDIKLAQDDVKSAQDDVQSEQDDIKPEQDDGHQWNLPEGAVRRLGRGSIKEVTYAPDGRWLAAAGSVGIWIYDARTRNPVKLLTEHTGSVESVSFSPDGKTIATGGNDQTVRLWNVETGRHIKTLTGHIDNVNSVSFSPDGQTIATASGGSLIVGNGDNTVRLWDVNTGRHIKTLTDVKSLMIVITFDGDEIGGEYVSGTMDDDEIVLIVDGSEETFDTFDLEEATIIGHRESKGHTDSVNSVSFSPDGSTIASGSDDDTVRLWDVNTGTHIKTLTGHTDLVRSVSFSPDGSTIASGSDDDTVRLWDVNTGTHIKTLTGHTGEVSSVSFSPDGSTIASGSGDGTVRLWDVNTGRHIKTLTGHTSDVLSISFSPDGQTLASGSGSLHSFSPFSPDDNTVRLWDANTGTHIKTLTGYTSAVNSVSFSPDGSTIASGNWDNTVRLWDADTGRHIKTLKGHIDSVWSVSFSPDGNTIASGSSTLGGTIGIRSGTWGKTVFLWDVNTGKYIDTLIGHPDHASSVRFSPDGSTIASGGDHTVRLWDANTRRHIDTLIGHTGEVYNVSFSPDGNTIASGSDDDTVRLWDANTRRHIKTLTGHTSAVNSVNFSPDGSTIASGSDDDTVRLWDANTGRHIKTLTGHTEQVNSISFSPDGNTIATGSGDNTVRLWDLWNVNTSRNIKILTGHTDWVRSVSFSPDGNTLASASSDGTILLWDVSGFGTERLTRSEPQTPRARRAVGQLQTAEQIAEVALASTVLIVMEDADGEAISTGSGFVVGEEMVVTNLHVVEGVFKGYVKPVGGYRQHRITGIVAMDTDQDLAVLSVSGVAASPLRLARGGRVSVGERVYVAGNPMGFLEGTFSDGLVSGIRDLGAGREWLQISAPISEGSSGGPVLNKHGEVIGVAVATLNVGQNLNFAIPVKYLRGLLDKVGR